VCDSDAHELTDSSMTLLLRNAGSASFQKKSGDVAFSVLTSCLTASLPVGCDHFKNCKPGACGLCDCTENAGDFDTDMATWVATGNKLSIDGLHCVGDAQPCSASSAASGYSAAECEARTGCQAFPSCTGNSTAQTTCADETTSAACTGQGCTWLDFDGCGGTPPSCKSLSDDTCGGSPGCHLSTN
jgi:hypothetical protein